MLSLSELSLIDCAKLLQFDRSNKHFNDLFANTAPILDFSQKRATIVDSSQSVAFFANIFGISTDFHYLCSAL